MTIVHKLENSTTTTICPPEGTASNETQFKEVSSGTNSKGRNKSETDCGSNSKEFLMPTSKTKHEGETLKHTVEGVPPQKLREDWTSPIREICQIEMLSKGDSDD